MTLKTELLKVLDNDNQPLCKRVKLADNAFKSSELPLQHKETFLITWILNKTNNSDKTTWTLLNNWLNSDQFKELNRNDIDNEDIINIIKIILEKVLNLVINDEDINKIVFDSIILISENKNFQQYFKHNIETYCKFVSTVLNNVKTEEYLEKILDSNLLNKNIITEENFHKNFLEIFTAFLNCLKKFQSKPTFQKISKTIEKCIFQKNHNSFKIFLSQFFDKSSQEKQFIPKILYKNLANFYNFDTENAKTSYKLLFNAFCSSFNSDFELCYSFFVTLIHLIGFDCSEKFILYKSSKLKINEEQSLTKSLEILFELLDVLIETKNDLNSKVNDVNFSEFLKNILKQILYFNNPSALTFKIFSKAINIDPLVIESILDRVIVYSMTFNNRNQISEYENLVIAIFEVYAKLHRIENLVAKIVHILYDKFSGKAFVSEETFPFSGRNDVKSSGKQMKNLTTENIVTTNITLFFSRSICNLASWQVINIFKSLLFDLRKVLTEEDIEKSDDSRYVYLEIVSKLTSTLLNSVRIAEHTVASSVVAKSVKCLEEMRDLLNRFGIILLNMEHNHTLMRSFLKLAYNWAEMYITLEYYSNGEVTMAKSLDNDLTACNVTYLHSYLNVKEWCLIAERIMNFGEHPCKILLHKLYVQKLRTLLLFEKNLSKEIEVSVVKSLTSNLEYRWKFLLTDKFIVNNLIPKMDSSSIVALAESLVNSNFEGFQRDNINSLLLNAINFVSLTKINKMLVKLGKKLDYNVFKEVSFVFDKELFVNDADCDEIVERFKEMRKSRKKVGVFDWKLKENQKKLRCYLKILKDFPFIYNSVQIQKIYLLYVFVLHEEFSLEFSKEYCQTLQDDIESIFIGILQQGKFKLLDVFDLKNLTEHVLSNFKEWELSFNLIVDNVFKCDNFVQKFEPVVTDLIKDLNNYKRIICSTVVIEAVNKLKKSKMSKETKTTAEKYKTLIYDKILNITINSEPNENLISGYSYALKHLLSQNDEEHLKKILEKLDSFTDFALKDTKNYNKVGYLMLFITVLSNRSKINDLKSDFTLKVWNSCKQCEGILARFEEYSQLVLLIFGHIPFEEFESITNDLLDITDKSLETDNIDLFSKYLRAWESILTCNLNPSKTKILQNALESLLHKILTLMQNRQYQSDLFENIVNFEKTLIQTVHLHLTPSIIDSLLLSVTFLISKEDYDFNFGFSSSIAILEHLLKYRKPLIMDRLPAYLRQYRALLKALCKKSNSDLDLHGSEVQVLSDCAHKLEKLTRNLVVCQKDMGRIAMYLIADILERYEQVTLYPNVKLHLNNCIYSLISLCDQHAVSFLVRVLSEASTEIFKIMYESYKKYYRFTGKV